MAAVLGIGSKASLETGCSDLCKPFPAVRTEKGIGGVKKRDESAPDTRQRLQAFLYALSLTEQ